MYNLFKVGKIYEDSKLYLQDIQSLIKTGDTDIKWINVTVVRNKRKVKQIEIRFITFYKSHTCN